MARRINFQWKLAVIADIGITLQIGREFSSIAKCFSDRFMPGDFTMNWYFHYCHRLTIIKASEGVKGHYEQHVGSSNLSKNSCGKSR